MKKFRCIHDGDGGRFASVGCFVMIAACALLSACDGKTKAAPAAPPPPQVSVIELKPQPVTVYEEYVAQTQSPNTIEIRSQVTGLLDKQAFADGARVKRGDVLYVIDPRPFESALAQAKGNLAQAEANRLNAEQQLARYTRLISQKAVSQQDYDNAVAQERATLAVVQAQRALVRTAELNLEFTTLRAPRDGFMSNSLVKPGALITAQQTLLTTLYSSDPMWVNFTISENRLLELQKRLKRPPDVAKAPPFRVRLADGTEYPLPGKLDFIDATLDPKSGTLQVRVSVANPDRVLRPGLFVRVIVPQFENPNAIRIPQQAVQELQGLKTVYVVGVEDKVEARQIVANYRVGNDWVVEQGLQAGEHIVVEGTGKLRAGMAVKPVPVTSAAQPDESAPPVAANK
jgi:membrane fusion protein (multidrug efflux system)